MADNETIASIIAEMRGFKRYAASDSNDCRYVAYWLYQTFADRIEAAHRRERGNAAELREALTKILNLTNSLDENCAVDPVEIRDIAKAALSAPPRNCDKYPTFNDAIRALADKRGWHDAKWNSERYCILASWLYAPATEKEGGAK